LLGEELMPRHFYFEKFATVDAFVDAAAIVLRDELARAGTDLRAVMLSAGTTSARIYQALLEKSLQASARAYVLFSDERHVPVGAADSTYGSAHAFLQGISLPEERVLRVHTELSLEEAAERYDVELRSYLSMGGRIPLAFIGIGPDGHTCSLFEEADLARGLGRMAIAVGRDPGPDRVSVTPELLAHVDRIIVMAVGEEKADVVEQLLSAPEEVVAGRALLACGEVEIWRA
jgi:6-phosphogluconolactonase